MKRSKKIKFGGYKIAALAMAILLWLYVMFSQNPITEQTYTVALETRNLASDLVLSEANYQIQVRVEAPKNILTETSSKDIQAYIDCAGLAAGQNQVPVKVILSGDMELLSINPESITVNIEKLKSKTFPVEVEISDTPFDGFMALNAIVKPDQISISGSSYYLEHIAKVYVPVSLLDLNSNFHHTVTIEAVDEDGNILTPWINITPEYADVFVPIVSEQPQKLLPISVSLSGKPANGYEISYISVDPAYIQVYGDIDVLQQLTQVKTAQMDISNSKKSVAATVDLLADGSFSFGEIDEVIVNVQIEKTAYKSFADLPIYAKNVGAGLDVIFKPSTMHVSLSGPSPAVGRIEAADIIPYVDCSNLTAGVYDLPIQFRSPANINTYSYSPQKVQVVIKETQ